MRIGVDSKRDALEALRAVEAWVGDPNVCATDEPGEMKLRLNEATRWLREHTCDRRPR
jgi:hypothetical protein